LSKYGLAVVCAGTLVEGETILLAAGALASRHVLNLAAVWAVAATGGWLGHVIWFGIGRFIGRARIVALVPRWAAAIDRVDGLIRTRPWLCIVSLQYLYGMRVPGAIALGLSSLSVRWFLLVEAVNCAIWAGLIVMLGYLIGESAARALQWSVRGIWVFAGMLIVTAVIYRTLHGRWPAGQP